MDLLGCCGACRWIWCCLLFVFAVGGDLLCFVCGRHCLVGVCVLIVLVFSFIFWFGLIALLVVWLELVIAWCFGVCLLCYCTPVSGVCVDVCLLCVVGLVLALWLVSVLVVGACYGYVYYVFVCVLVVFGWQWLLVSLDWFVVLLLCLWLCFFVLCWYIVCELSLTVCLICIWLRSLVASGCCLFFSCGYLWLIVLLVVMVILTLGLWFVLVLYVCWLFGIVV